MASPNPPGKADGTRPDTSDGYTGVVLRLVAALTLVAFTLLVGDNACCQDRCPESRCTGSMESAPHDSAPTCVQCAIGIEMPPAALSLRPLAVVSIVSATIVPWPLVQHPLPPDHPPRLAKG